MKKSKDTPQ